MKRNLRVRTDKNEVASPAALAASSHIKGLDWRTSLLVLFDGQWVSGALANRLHTTSLETAKQS